MVPVERIQMLKVFVAVVEFLVAMGAYASFLVLFVGGLVAMGMGCYSIANESVVSGIFLLVLGMCMEYAGGCLFNKLFQMSKERDYEKSRSVN